MTLISWTKASNHTAVDDCWSHAVHFLGDMKLFNTVFLYLTETMSYMSDWTVFFL